MNPHNISYVAHTDNSGYTHRPVDDPSTEAAGIGTQESVELHLRERDNIKVPAGRKKQVKKVLELAI